MKAPGPGHSVHNEEENKMTSHSFALHTFPKKTRASATVFALSSSKESQSRGRKIYSHPIINLLLELLTLITTNKKKGRRRSTNNLNHIYIYISYSVCVRWDGGGWGRRLAQPNPLMSSEWNVRCSHEENKVFLVKLNSRLGERNEEFPLCFGNRNVPDTRRASFFSSFT